jgi:hypothetical protein
MTRLWNETLPLPDHESPASLFAGIGIPPVLPAPRALDDGTR